MNNTKAHQQLVDDIFYEVGKLSKVRLWKRSVGVGRALHSENVISFGVKGETDLQGIMAPNGRMLSIEVKAGDGELSKDQISYRNMVIRFGGLYIEARTLKDTVQTVLRELSRT